MQPSTPISKRIDMMLHASDIIHSFLEDVEVQKLVANRGA